eukprot:CAMPEP_0204555868 /NCGR_PEP_ID=MMETSP0661-20131031/29158_1 /ASSEMBLY_ACC=CAM_ASM_000606 /TAXON_ID=109239 /ORGANISM="Alexandrium margalefi, Strain AMGDE01CS-322" /LENGTH=53 /DNA_ID=CAMNT_0051562967 /DNA_START=91 /DNA_END=249 /DNA_ORIENTATION=-
MANLVCGRLEAAIEMRCGLVVEDPVADARVGARPGHEQVAVHAPLHLLPSLVD